MRKQVSNPDHRNSFDFLRFAAATLVLFSHSYALSGRNAEEPIVRLTGFETGGGVAVAIFFIISGYLVSGSYLNSKNWLHFFWKRALRLFPALTVTVLLAMFVLGPLFTNIDLRDYFRSPLTWNYLKNIILYPHYGLPGLFASNPYPNAVNGSLWTLPVEFAMYLLVFAFGLTRFLSTRFILYIVLVFVLCYVKATEISKYVLLGIIPLIHFFKLGAYFFAGSAMYLFKRKISLRNDVFFCLIVLVAASFHTPYGPIVLQLALPYLVIHFAYIKIGRLHNFGRFGDFSYGIYVFAFPVQQIIMNSYGSGIGIPAFIAMSFCITLILAILSWHFVENPALKLKQMISFANSSLALPGILRGSKVGRLSPQENDLPIPAKVGEERSL